jgi:hypothetical protein
VPNDRHKDDRKFQCWLKDDEIARFDRLPQLDGCKGDHERLLKLMEMAETKNEDAGNLRNELKTAKLQIDKLLKDLAKKPKVEPQVIIKEVPKVEYRDRIVEKPIYKGEKIVEKIVEKPIEKIVEKPIYISDDDWLPKYWPFANQEEHDKWFNS